MRRQARAVHRGLTATAIALALAGGLAALDVLFPPPLPAPGVAVSAVVLDATGRPLRAFPLADGRWRLPVDPDKIDPAFLRALLEVEDRRFWSHPGVDVLALLRALRDALIAGQVRSGASTLTMQTARLLEPRPQRTPGAKLIEMVRALQLERRLDKQDILALYLTLAPYGGNIEGLRAGSWAWFGREPRELSPEQIALLLALPQAPEARRPDRHPEAARQARARLLRRLVTAGLLDRERANEAAAEAIPARQAFPNHAWHASERALAQAAGAGEHSSEAGVSGVPGVSGVRSTLDLRLQMAVESKVRALAVSEGPEVQAAALVIALDGRAVVAAAGSAGRDRSGGWLDLTARHRSPGSVLKPLIYALAMEDGRITAGTRIEDLPRRFSGYAPGNFDRRFRGEITVATALQQSLNLPAVQLLAAVGPARYASALALVGTAIELPPGGADEAGLALALGGLGVTVADVAALYAALGAGGGVQPLAWTELAAMHNRRTSAARLVSDGTAGRVLDILRDAPPPPGRLPSRLLSQAPAVAAKTGTSWGFRDAWAAGVVDGHVIVVWVGRPDGLPRPGVTGQRAALPLLFDLADLVAGEPAGQRLRANGSEVAPRHALARFELTTPGPQISFPPQGAELWTEDLSRGFIPMAAGTPPLRWYHDGQALPEDGAGQALWRPDGEGFHELVVVDGTGRSARVQVRIRRF